MKDQSIINLESRINKLEAVQLTMIQYIGLNIYDMYEKNPFGSENINIPDDYHSMDGTKLLDNQKKKNILDLVQKAIEDKRLRI